jgi:hypothetical protein
MIKYKMPAPAANNYSGKTPEFSVNSPRARGSKLMICIKIHPAKVLPGTLHTTDA